MLARHTTSPVSGIVINGMDAVQLRGRHWAHDLKSHTVLYFKRDLVQHDVFV